MNGNKSADEIMTYVDSILVAKTGKSASKVQTVLLRGVLQEKTYEQLAELTQYKESYLRQVAGPRLWKLLSQVFEAEIGKANAANILEERWRSHSQPASRENMTQNITLVAPENITSVRKPDHDFSQAPDTSIFYGRDRELQDLQKWILQDRCKLITIKGQPGIGKSFLTHKLCETIKEEFEFALWIPIEANLDLKQLLNHLVRYFPIALSDQERESILPNQQILKLLEFWQNTPCLLVLDGIEVILKKEELSGHLESEYEGYRKFLEQVGEKSHQLCLLLTSRESLVNLRPLESSGGKVRSLELEGLDERSAREMLQQSERISDSKNLTQLIQRYQGHPQELKTAAQQIDRLFGGNVTEVKMLLDSVTTLTLTEQKAANTIYQALSLEEKEIVRYLENSDGATFKQLLAQQNHARNSSKILEILFSLKERSILDVDETMGTFYLKDVMKRFLKKNPLSNSSQNHVS